MLKKKSKNGEESDSSDEDSDDEYNEETDAWLASLHKFMEERGECVDRWHFNSK